MAANTFGPFGAGVNPTTEEPEYDDAASAGAADTWFKPCIGNNPETGTKITARWLNFALDNLRLACRGMGVPDSAVDKLLLLKAIQKADRQIDSIGGATDLYVGLDEATGHHMIRTLEAGSNIAFTLVETPADSGKHKLRISYTAGGGGGGDPGDCVAIPTGIKGANIATPAQHRQTSSATVVNVVGGTAAMYTTEGSAWQPVFPGEIFYQDFGVPVVLHEVEARSDWGVVDATMTAGSLVKSSDSITWEVVASVSGLAPNVYITWTVPSDETCARFWGIRVDALSSAVNQWQGGMLKFFERVAP